MQLVAVPLDAALAAAVLAVLQRSAATSWGRANAYRGQGIVMRTRTWGCTRRAPSIAV